MTFKCPFKDQLAALDKVDGDEEVAAAGGAPSGSGMGGATGGRYVPPSMRGGPGAPAGESMFKRDDFPTLRIQSLSTDADEEDLKELFGSFGRIVRANVIRDRNTNESKGFGFVSYESRKDAEKAMSKMNGFGVSLPLDRYHTDTPAYHHRLRLAHSFCLLVSCVHTRSLSIAYQTADHIVRATRATSRLGSRSILRSLPTVPSCIICDLQ